MKWIDYREKLGLGFNDAEKTQMLKNRIHQLCNFLDEIHYNQNDNDPERYFLMVSETSYKASFSDIYGSIKRENTGAGVISKAVALINSMKKGSVYAIESLKFIEDSLEDLNIPYELLKDEDGVFIFPKGAIELDEKLVSEPLQWLLDYPRSKAAFEKALKAYAEVNEGNASDVADLCRKSLEIFFKEFFNSTKGLESLKADYGRYLKDCGVPSSLASDFQYLLQQYSKFNNDNAKHNDSTPIVVVEYILYSTGNIMRLLLQLRNKDRQGVATKLNMK